jgi:predicted ATP-grasp superfamily ATP-dependent carboligase
VTRVLIVGVATRGFAQSAVRAGYEVIAVDGFGDLDLRACARAVVVARAGDRFSVRAALAAARDLRRDAVCYVGTFENYPHAVAALAACGHLWGNAPAVLRRVRDPVRLAAGLARQGLAGPAVRRRAPGATNGRWLVKPRASGGGSGVARWRGGGVPRGSYLQAHLPGVPGSIVFAADGRRAVPLGVSRALAGDRRFGAAGYRYCGSILVPAGSRQLAHTSRLAAAVTELFGLVGVNGLDFMIADGTPQAIEVNPRYTASMELVERAHGLSIFGIHARACAGELPDFDLARARLPDVLGKAVVYARRDVTPKDTHHWLANRDVGDVPPSGERIARGRPICTIFARGRTVARCEAALARRAHALYRALEARRVRIA